MLRQPRRALLALAVILLAAAWSPTMAQVGGPYDLRWGSIDCGGGSSAGGTIVLFATVGQPDAGSASGGAYKIDGGFVPPGPVPSDVEFTEPVAELRLLPAFPNPLTTDASIRFELPREERVRLQIFAADGSLVRRLMDETVSAGRHAAQWDGTNTRGLPTAAGVYLVRLESGRQVKTNKLVVTR